MEKFLFIKQPSRKEKIKLYDSYYKVMYNTALRIVGNSYDAEDIVHDAFIKAFDKYAKFSGKSEFGAWLKKIVINQSIDFLRSKKHIVFKEETTQNSMTEDWNWDFDFADTKQQKIQQIKRAFAKLPDNYRTVFSLIAFEGYDYDEVSQILGIKQSAVRTKFSRAKKKLISLIDETEKKTVSHG